jgi:hypothetical protein
MWTKHWKILMCTLIDGDEMVMMARDNLMNSCGSNDRKERELREYGREEWARAAVVRPALGGEWNESASMVNLICT